MELPPLFFGRGKNLAGCYLLGTDRVAR